MTRRFHKREEVHSSQEMGPGLCGIPSERCEKRFSIRDSTVLHSHRVTLMPREDTTNTTVVFISFRFVCDVIEIQFMERYGKIVCNMEDTGHWRFKK